MSTGRGPVKRAGGRLSQPGDLAAVEALPAHDLLAPNRLGSMPAGAYGAVQALTRPPSDRATPIVLGLVLLVER